MKKLISILLAISITLSMCSCGHITINVDKDEPKTTQSTTKTTQPTRTYTKLNKPNDFYNFKCSYSSALWDDSAKEIIANYMEYICGWYEDIVAQAQYKDTIPMLDVAWDLTHLEVANGLIELMGQYPSLMTWCKPLQTLISDYLAFSGSNLKDTYKVSELNINDMGKAIQSALYSYYRVS